MYQLFPYFWNICKKKRLILAVSKSLPNCTPLNRKCIRSFGFRIELIPAEGEEVQKRLSRRSRRGMLGFSFGISVSTDCTFNGLDLYKLYNDESGRKKIGQDCHGSHRNRSSLLRSLPTLQIPQNTITTRFRHQFLLRQLSRYLKINLQLHKSVQLAQSLWVCFF